MLLLCGETYCVAHPRTSLSRKGKVKYTDDDGSCLLLLAVPTGTGFLFEAF